MLKTSTVSATNVGTDPAAILACSSASAPEVKPTVLVVEDDNYVSAAIWTLLKCSNFDVAVTPSGADGFKLACTLMPDIIVLDVDLPGMNGLEICRRLKSEPETSHIPVVFLSGQSQMVKEGLALGAEAFLVKPLGITQLADRLHQILASRDADQIPQNATRAFAC